MTETAVKVPHSSKFNLLFYMQLWVVSTLVKMTLKTFEECTRLQTFNRGGYQQIQLDCHYLREPLRNLVDNGAVVEIMLDEVSDFTKVGPAIAYSS
jgi:hypothetical protein